MNRYAYIRKINWLIEFYGGLKTKQLILIGFSKNSFFVSIVIFSEIYFSKSSFSNDSIHFERFWKNSFVVSIVIFSEIYFTKSSFSNDSFHFERFWKNSFVVSIVIFSDIYFTKSSFSNDSIHFERFWKNSILFLSSFYQKSIS
jgi:predicted metal-dependent hydrolase